MTNDSRHERARLDAHGFVHHPLFLRVIAHFDVADQREIFAERMPDESVIGEQATQIRVSLEENAEQIEGLALEPIGRRPNTDQRIDHRFVVVGAEGTQAQTAIAPNRKQMADDGKASSGRCAVDATAAIYTARKPGTRCRGRLPLGLAVFEVIDAGKINQYVEPQLGVIAQRRGDRQHLRRIALEGQFIRQRIHSAYRVAQNLERPARPARLAHGLTTVLVRAIFFCSWMMP